MRIKEKSGWLDREIEHKRENKKDFAYNVTIIAGGSTGVRIEKDKEWNRDKEN